MGRQRFLCVNEAAIWGIIMNLKLLVATGFLGLAGSVGAYTPASATLIDVIYKGTVTAGSSPDQIGLFGPADADLTGDAFVATFVMDTSKGTNYSTATENYITGGTTYGTTSPMISATLEINGMSHTIDGSVNGTVQTFLGYPGISNQAYHGATATNNDPLWLDVANAHGASVGNIPFTIDVPLDFVFDSSDVGNGEALFHSGGLSTSLDLGPTELIYQYPPTDGGGGAVPEPSTWALMLLGFVGLSAFGYRRTRSFAPAELI